MSGSATQNSKVRAHLAPMNLQVVFENADLTLPYRFLVGITDLDGNVVYDVKRAPFGDFRQLNDNGVLVYQRVLLDPRGGTMFLVAARFNQIGKTATETLYHTCRYGRIANSHALFEAAFVRSAETDTATASSSKDTVGGKVGGSYGIVSGEISGSHERQGPGSSVANAYSGEIRDVNVVWVAK